MSQSLRFTLVALVLVSVLTLAAFALLDSDASLDGTSWRLESWSVSSLAPPDFTITAKFADGQISGTSAVNSYGGPYEAGRGGSFSSGPINSTAMAGPEDAMRAEQIYFELLGEARRYSRENEKLTLSDDNDNQLLVFNAAE